MTLAPVPRQDSAAFAEASIPRWSPAMLFSRLLTVMAAIPRTVSINITIMTVRKAMPRSSFKLTNNRSDPSLTCTPPLETDIAGIHCLHQNPASMARIGHKRMVTRDHRRGRPDGELHRLPKPFITFRLSRHQRDLDQLNLVRRERRSIPWHIAQKVRLVKSCTVILIIDDPIGDPVVVGGRVHAAIAGIGQLEIFDPFCDGGFSVGPGRDTGHAPRQTGRGSSAEVPSVGKRHDLIANALQQIDLVLLLEPKRRRDRHVKGAGSLTKSRHQRCGGPANGNIGLSGHET